ncbi:hypothetical protein J3E69DRAFT_342506 [Trichoderma sp. SZMC 28015]
MLPVFHPFLQHYSLLQKLPSRGAALHTSRICSIRRNKILCLHKVLILFDALSLVLPTKAFPTAAVVVPLYPLTSSSTT